MKGLGSIRWRIKDDEGASNTIKMKDSLYVTDLIICILCPQHWIQQANLVRYIQQQFRAAMESVAPHLHCALGSSDQHWPFLICTWHNSLSSL